MSSKSSWSRSLFYVVNARRRRGGVKHYGSRCYGRGRSSRSCAIREPASSSIPLQRTRASVLLKAVHAHSGSQLAARPKRKQPPLCPRTACETGYQHRAVPPWESVQLTSCAGDKYTRPMIGVSHFLIRAPPLRVKETRTSGWEHCLQPSPSRPNRRRINCSSGASENHCTRYKTRCSSSCTAFTGMCISNPVAQRQYLQLSRYACVSELCTRFPRLQPCCSLSLFYFLCSTREVRPVRRI